LSGSSERGSVRLKARATSGAIASRAPRGPMPNRLRRVAIIEVWS
jgi:hypothetical protein